MTTQPAPLPEPGTTRRPSTKGRRPMNQRSFRITPQPWNLPFTVFTAEGSLKEFAELKLRSVYPGGNQLYLADIEKRLGFTLTAHDARTWAKALTEAANALEAAEPKP